MAIRAWSPSVSPARKKPVRPRYVWWLVPLGVGFALWAFYGLITAEPAREPTRPSAAAQQPGEPSGSGEIGEASREALREILRGADADERPSGEEAPR